MKTDIDASHRLSKYFHVYFLNERYQRLFWRQLFLTSVSCMFVKQHRISVEKTRNKINDAGHE